MILKRIFTFFFLLNTYVIFSQDGFIKNFVVADAKSHQIIKECSVFNKLGEVYKNQLDQFVCECNLIDSLFIIAPDYEFELISCKDIKDTIFLKLNTIELEEVTVVGAKKKVKFSFLGSRRKKVDCSTAFGFDYFRQQKLITFFPNNSGKNLKIMEGYIYLDIKDTIPPNILISIYENNNGLLGREIASGIKVVNQQKRKGWFQLELNNQRIKIPNNGIFISVLNYNNASNSIFLGLNQYQENLNIKTYTIVNQIWYELPLIDKNLDINNQKDRKHYGVKFYFKVK